MEAVSAPPTQIPVLFSCNLKLSESVFETQNCGQTELESGSVVPERPPCSGTRLKHNKGLRDSVGLIRALPSKRAAGFIGFCKMMAVFPMNS